LEQRPPLPIIKKGRKIREKNGFSKKKKRKKKQKDP